MNVTLAQSRWRGGKEEGEEEIRNSRGGSAYPGTRTDAEGDAGARGDEAVGAPAGCSPDKWARAAANGAANKRGGKRSCRGDTLGRRACGLGPLHSRPRCSELSLCVGPGLGTGPRAVLTGRAAEGCTRHLLSPQQHACISLDTWKELTKEEITDWLSWDARR